MYKNEIWVVCEERGGQLSEASLELIYKARVLADTAGAAVAALLSGKGCSDLAPGAFAVGADIACLAREVSPLCTDYELARVVAGFAESGRPLAILLPATVFGRAVAPQIAALLQTGLTADCTGLAIEENGLLVQTRPAFGGNILAEVIGTGSYPQMATVRPRAMPMPVLDLSRTGKKIPIPCPALALPLRILRRVQKQPDETLVDARVIIAGGIGAGGEKGFAKLLQLAQHLQCPLGASRAAVNAGLAPYAAQVGQTGVMVRPKLYFAFGISGAVQHISGMSASETIIAVNTDRCAPIFDYADYGIVGDSMEVADLLLSHLSDRRV